MRKEATFSEDRQYRYTLWRVWDESKPYCQFIGLNPSTADETQDDPTVRRCINYAKEWGYGGLCMTNLFAFRATNPKDMFDHYKQLDSQSWIDVLNINSAALIESAKRAGVVVAAWGTLGQFRNLDKDIFGVCVMCDIPLHHLGLTKDGHPKHPLYLKKDLKPILWE